MRQKFILILLILLSLGLGLGCSFYNEGDDVAKQAFDKMTIEEKTIYNAVQDVWSQSHLEQLRDAIRLREIKPDESNIPFIDVAKIIISNNNVTLKIKDGWDTDTKNKKILGRWSRINQDWYKQILASNGIVDFKPKKLIPVIKDVEENKVVSNYITQPQLQLYTNKNSTEEKITVLTDLLKKDEYDDLYFEIKNCEEAVKYYNEVVKDRLVSYEDKDILTTLSIKCKAIKISNKLSQ